jgi:type II secretory pathway predicted ATPase ExeA
VVHKFKEVKELFRDRVDINLYVPLSQKKEIDLNYAISEKEKIILVYGLSGNGKTFLMKKVYDNLVKKRVQGFEFFFIANPFTELKKLEYIISLKSENHIVVFIDEAQILKNPELEKLRMLSDNQNYTFVLSTHELQAKEIFSKTHFKNRINYIIHLRELNVEKIELFITSKLTQNNFYELASIFSVSNYKLIYNLTKGNLREINRLLYKTFDILDFFQEKYPKKVQNFKLKN